MALDTVVSCDRMRGGVFLSLFKSLYEVRRVVFMGEVVVGCMEIVIEVSVGRKAGKSAKTRRSLQYDCYRQAYASEACVLQLLLRPH